MGALKLKEYLPILRIKEISKEFEGSLGYFSKVLDKISFEIFPGEFAAVLSPKGAGKSTLLKVISGIYSASSGELDFGTRESSSAINLVSYIPCLPSSYPWFSVKQNIEYFLKFSIRDPFERENKLKSLIKLVGLTGYENHYPDNRSLGFRFRISLARSLACDPKLLLIDEPFNEMDEMTKKEMYILLRHVWNSTKTSILFATSTIQEAYLLSDLLLLLSNRPLRLLTQIRLNLPVERDFGILKERNFDVIKETIEKAYSESGYPVKTVLSV